MARRSRRPMAAGAATALLLTLAGCGGRSGDDPVTLKLVAADYGDSAANSSQKYWDGLAEEFEAAHPGIRIDVDVYNWSTVDKKVADMVKSGQAPDMAQIGAYADYAAQNKLYSADELLSIPAQADFLPGLARAGEVHRVQYGLPFASSTRLLFYNKTLFEEAGITEPPKTWDDIQQDAEALKQAGVKTPYALPLGPEESQAETMMWMLSGGGGYTGRIGSYVLNSAENVETLNWLRDELVGKGLTNPDPAKTDRQDAFNAFTNGDVGMLNGHPTLMKQAEKRGVDYGMVRLPGKDGPSQSAMGVADWMTAFKRNGHPDETGAFLDFVYREKNVLAFAKKYDLLPVTTSASEEMRDDKSHQHLWKFLDQLSNAEFYPADKTSWAEVSKNIKRKIGATVRKDGDPAGVLDQLQSEADTSENAARQ